MEFITGPRSLVLNCIEFIAEHNIEYNLITLDLDNIKILDLYKENKKGWNKTIIEASIKGDLNIIKTIIENMGYNPLFDKDFIPENINPKKFIKPITLDRITEYAIYYNHLHIIKYFMEHKTINIKIDSDYIFKTAAEKGYLDIIKYYYEEVSKDNSCDEFMYDKNNIRVPFNQELKENVMKYYINIALYNAAIKGQLNVIKYLISEAGADVYHDRGSTLFMAIVYGQLDVIKYFINEVGIWKVQNERGFTQDKIFESKKSAISNTTILCKYKEIFDFLIENGCRIYNDFERTLVWMCKCGDLNMVKQIITKSNVYVHYMNEKPLITAVINGHFEIVKYLVEGHYLTDSDRLPEPDNTIIGWFCDWRTKCIDTISRKIDVRAHDNLALKCARANGHKEIAKYLLNNGARHRGFKRILQILKLKN